VSERDDTELDEATEATRREGRGANARARPPSPSDPLARGATLGRYIVLHQLGSGGMGVVYAAYDPELDRKVAIKLLQARGGGSGGSGGSRGQAWLVREAQAMARLSHPNVIAVHDVGTLPGDRVFVAMELVEGTTLRKWLALARRGWRDVVDTMLASGAGLAAAHAGGLVHRDFKPDNVLVGDDGRVRVMDFGLARLRGDEDGEPVVRPSDSLIESRSPLSDSLTIAGTVIGTPAYMAPELYAGEGADARSDQFSFGVALYEALFRVRPFARNAPRDLPPRPPPAKTAVPGRVQRVVMRAIATARADRYGSMDELLVALRAAATPRRTARLAVGTVALASAGIGVAFALSSPAPASESPPTLCRGIERRLDGVWDAATRQQVEAAFIASGRPYAHTAYAGLARALDRYAAEWSTTATESCEATRLRGEQTEEVLSLRQACLDQRLEELRALARLLARADKYLVERGDKIAFGLEPVRRCSNVAALRAPGAPPTEPRAELEQLHGHLADAKAAMLIGKYFPAMESARQTIELSDRVRYEPFRAEALLVRGAALAGIGNTEDAGPAFADAVWAAMLGNRDDLVVGGALSSAAVSAAKQGEARLWLGLARTALRRMGSVESYLELRLRQVEGLVAATTGDTRGALAAQESALAMAERLYGADSPMVWNDVEVMGVTLAKAGAFEKALPLFERSLQLRETSVGPDHPDVAVILTNLGASYSSVGQADRAQVAYERALTIRERVDGPDSPMMILTLNNMADGMIKAGDAAGALGYIERGRGLAERLVGRANPLYHAVATTHAEALVAAGRTAQAMRTYDEVLALEAQFSSPYLGATLTSRAKLALAAARWAEAAGFEQRAIAAMEAASGAHAPELWQPLYGLARAKIGLGKPAEARPLLERALVIADRAQLGAAEVTPIRTLLDQL
jgi:eukaryotic-like serine/threonine-protein kinase